MFLLHDSTRRRMCRWAFLALGLLPLLAVCGWSCWVQTDDHCKSHEVALSQLVGAQVTLEEVTLPTPNITLYHGVTLSDGETGAPIVRLRLIEVERHGNTYDVIVSQPVVSGDYLSALAQLVQRTLRSPLPSSLVVRMLANEIVVEMPEGAQTLVNVRSELNATPAGPEIKIGLSLAGAKTQEAIMMRIGRNRQVSPAESFVQLNTRGNRLPCWLVGSFWPAALNLGSDSEFQGSLTVIETPTGWHGEIEGEIDQIELDRLVTDQFPHKLSGVAKFANCQAQFRHGRLEGGKATLVAGPGLVDRSLITSAMSNLAFQCEWPAEQFPHTLVYNKLAMKLTIDSRGLVIDGVCPAGGGALLVDKERIILRSPENLPQPVVNLVRTLVPQNEVLVPATRETDAFFRALPIPRILAPLGKEPTPYARAKLKESR